MKESSTPYKWLLFIGLSIWILGNVVLNISYGAENIQNENNQPINQYIASMSFFWRVILIAICMPILEEIAFRGWLLAKRWIKVISLICIMGFIYASTQNIWLCIPLEIVVAYLMFTKPSYKKRTYTVVLVSLLFGLVHLQNYANTGGKVAVLLATFGMGLVLSYLTWRFNIWWAILLHTVNNAFAIFTHGLDNQNASVFITDKYEMHYSKTLFQWKDTYFWGSDTIKYDGMLKNFANNYYDKYLQNGNSIYHFNQDIATEWIDVTLYFKDTSDMSYREAFVDVLEKNQYILDTTWMPLYIIDINTSDNIVTLYPTSNKEEFATGYTLKDMKQIWQTSFGVPLKLSGIDSQIKVHFPLHSKNPTNPNSNKLIRSFITQDFFDIMSDNKINITIDSSELIPVLRLKKV